MTQNTLLIKPCNDNAKEYYENFTKFYNEDAGLDLIVIEDVVFKLYETVFVDFGIQCEMLNEKGTNDSYMLVARSSISKTPLILHNSIGIIDAGYRGKIMGAFKFLPRTFEEAQDKNAVYILKSGTRIAQICHPSLNGFNCKVVENLSETKRGTGGFGSTGI